MNYKFYFNEETTGIHMLNITPDSDDEKTFSVFIPKVNEDESGKSYFMIPNYRDTDNLSFNGKIRDAVEEIRNGIGDVIATDDVYYTTIIRYIDRGYGESIRKLYLQKYAKTDFCYGVVMLFHGLTKPEFMTKDFYTVSSDPLVNAVPVQFDTETEAINYIQSFYSQVETFRRELMDITKRITDPLELSAAKDELSERTNSTVVVCQYAFENTQYLEVVQMVRG